MSKRYGQNHGIHTSAVWEGIRLGGRAHIFRSSRWLGEDVWYETKATGFRNVAEAAMDLTEIIL